MLNFKKLLLVFVGFIVFLRAREIQSMDIVVTVPSGGWYFTIGASDLAGPGGSDFITYKESATNFVDIAITPTAPNNTWRVTIHRVDTNWPSFLQLLARGTAPTNQVGANRFTWNWGYNTYGQVTATPQIFFNGRRARSGIKVQLRVEGISIDSGLNIGTYSTTVVYTATDT